MFSMSSAISQFDRLALSPAFLLLHSQVSSFLDKAASAWLENSLARVSTGDRQTLVTSFSLAARKVGKASLCPTQADSQQAESIHPGWDFSHWSVDQATRTLLLLAFPSNDQAQYRQAVMQLFDCADVGERVALYQSLSVLPHAASFTAQGIEGVRSSMTAVFEAIALRNPYPKDYFDQPAWNQMVLKALFEGSPLYLIHGLDDRANADLATMLAAYAHERWSAGRPVSPELWRSVGPFAQGSLVEDLQRVLQEDDPVQQAAAALACYASAEARSLLADRPKLVEQIESGELNWECIGSQLH